MCLTTHKMSYEATLKMPDCIDTNTTKRNEMIRSYFIKVCVRR